MRRAKRILAFVLVFSIVISLGYSPTERLYATQEGITEEEVVGTSEEETEEEVTSEAERSSTTEESKTEGKSSEEVTTQENAAEVASTEEVVGSTEEVEMPTEEEKSTTEASTEKSTEVEKTGNSEEKLDVRSLEGTKSQTVDLVTLPSNEGEDNYGKAYWDTEEGVLYYVKDADLTFKVIITIPEDYGLYHGKQTGENQKGYITTIEDSDSETKTVSFKVTCKGNNLGDAFKDYYLDNNKDYTDGYTLVSFEEKIPTSGEDVTINISNPDATFSIEDSEGKINIESLRDRLSKFDNIDIDNSSISLTSKVGSYTISGKSLKVATNTSSIVTNITNLYNECVNNDSTLLLEYTIQSSKIAGYSVTGKFCIYERESLGGPYVNVALSPNNTNVSIFNLSNYLVVVLKYGATMSDEVTANISLAGDLGASLHHVGTGSEEVKVSNAWGKSSVVYPNPNFEKTESLTVSKSFKIYELKEMYSYGLNHPLEKNHLNISCHNKPSDEFGLVQGIDYNFSCEKIKLYNHKAQLSTSTSHNYTDESPSKGLVIIDLSATNANPVSGFFLSDGEHNSSTLTSTDGKYEASSTQWISQKNPTIGFTSKLGVTELLSLIQDITIDGVILPKGYSISAESTNSTKCIFNLGEAGAAILAEGENTEHTVVIKTKAGVDYTYNLKLNVDRTSPTISLTGTEPVGEEYWGLFKKFETNFDFAIKEDLSGISSAEIATPEGDKIVYSQSSNENHLSLHGTDMVDKVKNLKSHLWSGKLSLTDKAGNEGVLEDNPTTVVNGKTLNFLVDSDFPTFKFAYNGGAIDTKKMTWFAEHPKVLVEVNDDAGFQLLNLKVNNVDTSINWNQPNYKKKDTTSSLTETDKRLSPYSAYYTVSDETQGKYDLLLTGKDFGDNEIKNQITYSLDTIAPQLSNISATLSNTGIYFEGDDRQYFSEIPTLTVNANDGSGSGIDTVIVYKDGEEYTRYEKQVNEGGNATSWSFTPETGEYSFEFIDLVGNTSGILTLDEICSQINTSYLVNDIEVPSIETSRPEGDVNSWYADDVTFDLKLSDDIGINRASIKINDTEVDAFSATEGGVLDVELSAPTSKVKANEDGSYVVVAEVYDNANNLTTWTDTIYIDRDAPVITKFVFTGEGFQEGLTNGTKGDYGFYFRGGATCDVYVDDGEVTSGLKEITVSFLDKSGKVIADIGKTVKIEGGSAQFKIAKDFKGWVEVTATDMVGNTSSKTQPDGVITEDSNTAVNSIGIDINMPATDYKDNKGLLLYNTDIDINTDVRSELSGVRKIEWGINAETRGTAEIDNSGKVSGNGIRIETTEHNLVITLVDAMKSADNANGNEIWVKVTDRAGIESEAKKQFSIDRDKPVVSVSYDKTNRSTYYNTNRVATITVRERNFDASRVKFTGKYASLGGWSSNGDTHTMRMVFSKDADYKFNVSATDLAANASNVVVGNKFTIDKTKPEISVTWSNNDAKNGKYYNASRTATITVKEHNFDPSAIKVTGGNVGGWGGSGDTHTASVSFSENGDYKLSVSGQDRAGNVGTSYESEEFTIDLDKPKIKVSGVEEGISYHKSASATVTVNDNNLDTKVSVVSIEGRRNGKLDLQGTLSLKGGVIKLNELPKEEKWDDYYTLKAIATDLAGNSEKVEFAFSVNRFGSDYEYLSVESLGTYVNESKDVVISESNVDEVDTSKSRVVITLNGTEIEVPEGAVKIVDKGIVDGKHVYEYTIDKSVFTKDGKYVIQIFSVAKDGTESDSVTEEYSFVLDTAEPEIIISGVRDRETYNEYERKATIDIRDLSGVDSISVKLNGKDLKYTEKDGMYQITIPESSRTQTLVVEVIDKAGNVGKATVKDFLVTSSKLGYLNHQWWFWLIVVILLGLLIGGLLALVLVRNKRSREMDAELTEELGSYHMTASGSDELIGTSDQDAGREAYETDSGSGEDGNDGGDSE